MIKLLLPFVASALLATTFCVSSQELVANQEAELTIENDVIEQENQASPIQTEQSLWQQTMASPSLDSLSVYLARFPNGQYSDQAKSSFKVLEDKLRSREKEDKQLDAYRKRQTSSGIVLELDSKFSDIKPYVRSMVNSCGYTLVKPHRFAKRVYPTLVIGGKMFNSVSYSEHTVTLDLALVLKTTTREIAERQKMRSYRTSSVDAHQALVAGFEDIGAQMKSSGFCIVD
jgi:hypothetical protein